MQAAKPPNAAMRALLIARTAPAIRTTHRQACTDSHPPQPHTHTPTHIITEIMATTTVTPAAITAAFPALAPALAALPKPQGKTLSYGTAGAYECDGGDGGGRDGVGRF